MKSLKKVLVFLAVLFSACFVFAAEVSTFSLDAEIQIKQIAKNESMFAWRDAIYVDVEVEEGSDADYKIRAVDAQKGYTNFELMQIGSKATVKVDPKGKETVFKPGKVFTKDGGVIWFSFVAPDKKTYKIPTAIKFVPKKDAAPAVLEQPQPQKEVVLYKSLSPEVSSPSFDEQFFIRYADSYPNNGEEECTWVDISKQLPDKNALTNEQVVIKNLPDGTKSKIFLMDNKEILVYLAPDLTLRAGGDNANSYTLFYTSRRLGKDEPFTQPKRVMDNPKINGKVCNIAEFTGDVYSGNGKKRLVLVWTQFTKQIDDNISEEELCRTTAIYSCALEDDANMKWEKPEVVNEVIGTLQFHPELYNSGKSLSLRVTNRTDNDYTSREVKVESPVNFYFYKYEKNNKWKSSKGNEFTNIKETFPFTDKNSSISETFEYVLDKDKNVNGAVYSAGYVDEDDGKTYINCFAKTYVKSPDTKKMVWTESVPVIYHNKSDEISCPSATIRPTGEWLISYLSKTETGNNLCIAKVLVEPCLVTKTMIPNLEDMEHPGSSLRFTVEVRNEGLAICEGCDVLVKNELNTEAGKITAKQAIYPGQTYYLPSVYAKLKEDPKEKNGVVLCETVKAEAKPIKTYSNSKFAVNKANFTVGVPHFKISDMFVKTKGYAQTFYMAIGTSNGVKVRAPGVEIVLTEIIDGDESVEIIPIDYDLSDDYLLVDYAYLTGNNLEDSFDVKPYVHFAKTNKHLQRYTHEELEEMTPCSGEFTIYNPLFTKEPVSGGVVSTTFTKKTKIMDVEFVVMNNWPELVEDEVLLELVNVTTGGIEQVLKVPVRLEVLKNQYIKCSFEPSYSDTDEYIVRFKLASNEDEIEEDASSSASLAEEEEVILEGPASSSETESFDEVEDVTE